MTVWTRQGASTRQDAGHPAMGGESPEGVAGAGVFRSLETDPIAPRGVRRCGSTTLGDAGAVDEPAHAGESCGVERRLVPRAVVVCRTVPA